MFRRYVSVAVVIVIFLFITLRSSSTIKSHLPLGHHSSGSKRWFIGTVSPASGMFRRHLIRETWQRLYKTHDIFTTRFILSNPGDTWRPMIERENATYGDLIVLDHLPETAEVANSNKSIEYIKYLVDNNMKYDFVSKLDDDSFLDAYTFYTQYLKPIKSESPRTIFGRKTRETIYDFRYPGGQFYTISWDLVEILARLHKEKPPPRNKYEDVLIGKLLSEAKEDWTFTELSNREAFDFEFENKEKKVDPWAKARADLNAYEHAIGKGAINPHRLKDDTVFLQVASCYGPTGLTRFSTADGAAEKSTPKKGTDGKPTPKKSSGGDKPTPKSSGDKLP
jgi:hypothetical protein